MGTRTLAEWQVTALCGVRGIREGWRENLRVAMGVRITLWCHSQAGEGAASEEPARGAAGSPYMSIPSCFLFKEHRMFSSKNLLLRVNLKMSTLVSSGRMNLNE